MANIRLRHILFFLAGLLLVLNESVAQTSLINPESVVSISPAVGINSRHLEFAPVYYGSGIVFVQAKERGDLFDRNIGMPYFELMYAELDPNGLPRKEVSFSPNIRTKYHEGPSCFSLDEEKIYFTRSNYKDGANIVGTDKTTTLKIYSAVKGLEDWEEITELPFCSDDYSACHPSVSQDDHLIIFSSNMPGGYGGMDLYRSDKIKDVWTEPVNLGPSVNTPDNEIMPYLHPGDILIFSSDGHSGIGKLDLFLVNLAELPNGQIELMPEPFNSMADDLGFCISHDGLQGFFSSSRKKGQGKDDIYHFLASEELIKGMFDEEKVVLRILDEETDSAIGNVTLWYFPMGPSGPVGIENYFETEILPTEEEEGALLLKIRKTPKTGTEPMGKSNSSGLAQVDMKSGRDYLIQLHAEGYIFEEHLLESGQFDFGDTIVIPLHRKKVAIAESDTETPDVSCVDIAGRIVTRGSEEPVNFPTVSVENTCDGFTTTIQADELGRYSFCLDVHCTFVLQVEKVGYLPYTARINPGDTTFRTHYLTKELGAPLVKGDIIVLENIYYDFNKSAIQKGAAEELDAVAALMKKYPSMRIELISHTDSRGTNSYNLELAERRAFAAKDYLTARGVDGTRIETHPKGEQEIRNRCVDGVVCSDEEHRYNRRTEIKVLHIDEGVPDVIIEGR